MRCQLVIYPVEHGGDGIDKMPSLTEIPAGPEAGDRQEPHNSRIPYLLCRVIFTHSASSVSTLVIDIYKILKSSLHSWIQCLTMKDNERKSI